MNDIQRIQDELRELKIITGNLPVRFSSGEASTKQVALLKTTSGPDATAYPNPDTRPFDNRVYYCLKASSGTYTQTVGSVLGGGGLTYDATGVYVLNVGNAFIPQSTTLPAINVSGKWWCNYSMTGADIVEGLLTTTLAAFGTATMQVYSEIAGSHAVSGYTLTVSDKQGYAGAIGSRCIACKPVPYGTTWRVLDIGCP